MKKSLLIRAEAEADLDEAYQWYEQQVRGLGAQFLLCVDAVMASIERNPQLYPVVHKGIIRRALTRRFPSGGGQTSPCPFAPFGVRMTSLEVGMSERLGYGRPF